MGLSELMRIIIIFVTFCLNKKKKSHKDSEAKSVQINFHCNVKELNSLTVEDYWTECQYYDIVCVCFVLGNGNHCCFCCGQPFTMLGVSLFISYKNKIQCVCKKKKKMLIKQEHWDFKKKIFRRDQ